MTKKYPLGFPHGLMFHRFHKSNESPRGQGSIDEIQFEKLLHHVGIEHILSPIQWIEKIKSNGLSKQDMCLTFDDGLKSQVEVALPVLEQYNLKAFFFIISGTCRGKPDLNEIYNLFATTKFSSFYNFVEVFFENLSTSEKNIFEHGYCEYSKKMKDTFPFYSDSDIKYRFVRNKMISRKRFEEVINAMIEKMGLNIEDLAQNHWMTDQDLKELALAGHEIGLHSYSHPLEFANLNEVDQKREYEWNYEHLSHITGKKIEAVAHPLGSYNETTLRVLSNMGIKCGFRSNSTNIAYINDGKLEIAREDAVNILKTISE